MQVITLNSELFSLKCHELISKVDFKPDLVIGILNGGGFVLDEIKTKYNFESNNFGLVKYQRYNKLKNNFIINFLIKLLPYYASNRLRNIESYLGKKSITSINLSELSNIEIDLNIKVNLDKSINSILIIDDAIDTGRTIFIVKNNLSKLFPKAIIKTAVISWTLEMSIIKPDYHIFKNVLVRFPWSKDYKKNTNFEK